MKSDKITFGDNNDSYRNIIDMNRKTTATGTAATVFI
jgi:hypothetical protein